MHEFVQRFAGGYVAVRSPQSPALAELLRRDGATVEEADGELHVTGAEAAGIGELAAANGIVLHELAPRTASLEEAFLEVTRGAQEYVGEGMPDA